MTYGHRLLNESIGRCARPKTSWQVDPFGHARENAFLFAKMGFDSLYFSREHMVDLSKRLTQKKPEMIWHTSDDVNVSDSVA